MKEDKSKSRGLGDTIAKVARAAGIRGYCPGCERRRHLLNKKFPYRSKK